MIRPGRRDRYGDPIEDELPATRDVDTWLLANPDRAAELEASARAWFGIPAAPAPLGRMASLLVHDRVRTLVARQLAWEASR